MKLMLATCPWGDHRSLVQRGIVLTAGTSRHELLQCCHCARLLRSLGWLHDAGQMGSITNVIMVVKNHVKQEAEHYW